MNEASNQNHILRIGLLKSVPVKWKLKTNWETFEKLVIHAKNHGIQILCTPECFLDGYVVSDKKGWSKKRFLSISQSLNGDNYLRKAMNLASELQVFIIFGFTERAEKGCYNSAALINDCGELLGCYHKTHLLDHDKKYLTGHDLPVWETPLGKIGIMICADRRWPETARTLKIKGAEIIMNPSYGMWHLDNEWWMRTRSYENEIYICFVHPNVSFITNPEGGLEAKLQNNIPNVLIHDIDLSFKKNKMFPNRRVDIYE